MNDQKLYDDDILLWSEQQADVIRGLGRTRRDVPNELDIENVAEEIEGVGRSELAAVKSYIRLIFIHSIKLVVEAESEAARHWRSEIVAFHADMMGRYSPSMQQRIDVNELWRSACEQAAIAYEGGQQNVANLPVESPFTLDALLGERIDSSGLVQRLGRTMPRGE